MLDDYIMGRNKSFEQQGVLLVRKKVRTAFMLFFTLVSVILRGCLYIVMNQLNLQQAAN